MIHSATHLMQSTARYPRTPLRIFARTIGTFLLTTLVFASSSLIASDEKPIKNGLINQATTLPDASFHTIMRTITWPVGYRSAEHSHAGPGPRYVLQGIVEITENGTTTRYGQGDVFWYSAEYPHIAENVDSKPTTVLIVEMLPSV